MLDRLNAAAERVARTAVWAGGAMLIFAACLVSLDVVLRKLFAVTFTGADEISSYLFAVSTSWAFAYVLLHRGNVRIDAVYLHLSPRTRAALDLFALVVLGLFMAYFAYRAALVLQTTIDMKAHSTTPLQTPLVIPQSFWVAGLALFMVTWVLVLVRLLAALVRGDLSKVNRIAGAPTLDEEVSEELGADLVHPKEPA